MGAASRAHWRRMRLSRPRISVKPPDFYGPNALLDGHGERYCIGRIVTRNAVSRTCFPNGYITLAEVVRAPGVEPGSMASEATTLSIVLRSQGTERLAFPGHGAFQAAFVGWKRTGLHHHGPQFSSLYFVKACNEP